MALPTLLGCPWKLVTLVSQLVCFTYLQDVSNLYGGEIIQQAIAVSIF